MTYLYPKSLGMIINLEHSIYPKAGKHVQSRVANFSNSRKNFGHVLVIEL